MAQHRDVTAIRIRNRFAAVHIARLDSKEHVELPDAPFVQAYVAAGRLNLEGGATVDSGDAMRLTAGGAQRLQAVEQSEVLICKNTPCSIAKGGSPDVTRPSAAFALAPLSPEPSSTPEHAREDRDSKEASEAVTAEFAAKPSPRSCSSKRRAPTRQERSESARCELGPAEGQSQVPGRVRVRPSSVR